MSQQESNMVIGSDDLLVEEGIAGPAMRTNSAKRLLDIVGSATLIVLLLPVMFIVAFLISRDGGSPIYRQRRVGLNGKMFDCLKFRSMILNSQEVLDNLLKSDPEALQEWRETQKLSDDPRITRIGKFIRATSLDELPQLWNVLKGDMSLVGPRPIIRDEIIRYGCYFAHYKSVRPGLTGLWQVSGRSNTSYSHRVELDTNYVNNVSFVGDIQILLKTVKVVLKREGAR